MDGRRQERADARGGERVGRKEAGKKKYGILKRVALSGKSQARNEYSVRRVLDAERAGQ